MKNLITRNIDLINGEKEQKREEILEYFLTTYTLYENLFDDVLVDDTIFYMQPEPLRHKLIFYYGHTATFYINKLILGGYIKNRINPNYESIFAIGVDEMSWDDLNNGNYNWPKIKDVREYRKIVKDVVSKFINECEFSMPITWDSPMWVIMMGIEHEKIHIETSSVLIRQLPIEYVKSYSFGVECSEYGENPKNELLDVTATKIEFNRNKENSQYYGWDNEFGYYSENILDFKASKYLVSNGEFLEFVNDGGYENDLFWSKEGNSWKKYKNTKHPIFWIKTKNGYDYRTMTNIIKLPLNWPVDVNYLEAEAFCKWKSKKSSTNILLPSEAQWLAIVKQAKALDENQWKDIAPFNINLEHYSSSCPVDKFESNGFFDIFGNVWQWTTTPIDGFEGFEVHKLYDDFSVPTFDGRHNIIKGGSFISCGNEVLKESRYAFRRHFPQHAGFRYIQIDEISQHKIEKENRIFEDTNNDFFQKAVKKVSLFNSNFKKDSALNLGCFYGSATIELAKSYKNVIGVDFTARNILNAQKIKENKNIENCQFWQGDSCNLKPHFKDFDLILVTNNFKEIYNIDSFLDIITNRLNDGGLLVIHSNELSNQKEIYEKLNTKLIKIGDFAWKK